MQYVVVPLSATPKGRGLTLPALVNLLISHIFFVGIPITLVVSRAGDLACPELRLIPMVSP